MINNPWLNIYSISLRSQNLCFHNLVFLVFPFKLSTNGSIYANTKMTHQPVIPFHPFSPPPASSLQSMCARSYATIRWWGRRRSYADRSILHGHRRDRAQQFPHTLVPAQSRRGDWEILWTDGSGSRLVLLLLLRPLAPSIGAHTVRDERRGKRDAGKWAAMCAERIKERRKKRMRMLRLSTGCPAVYLRKRDETGWKLSDPLLAVGIGRVRDGFVDFNFARYYLAEYVCNNIRQLKFVQTFSTFWIYI